VKKWGKRLLIAALSTVLSLALLEVGLIVTQHLGLAPDFFRKLNQAYYSFEPGQGPGLYYAHPYMSYAMRPGYEGPSVRINSHGFRGAELTDGKADEVFRIVCLGGSTTYGIAVPEFDTYPYLLQQELRTTIPNVEVVNAGMVSGTTAEALALFTQRIIDLEPDVVVYYEGYNDLVPRIFSGFRSDYEHFRRSPHDRLAWYEHSQLYRLVDWKLVEGGWVRPLNSSLIHHIWRFENLPTTDSDRISNFQSTDAKVYRRNLKSLVRLALAYDMQVVLATFGFRDELKDWNGRMPESLWAEGIAEHNEIVRELSEEAGVPLADFESKALTLPKSAFSDSIHMTVEGNLALARAVAAAIQTP
jgi:lysophospholipase L1-like esterase